MLLYPGTAGVLKIPPYPFYKTFKVREFFLQQVKGYRFRRYKKDKDNGEDGKLENIGVPSHV